MHPRRYVVPFVVLAFAALVLLAPTAAARAMGSGSSQQANGWIIGTPPVDGYGVILHTTNGGGLWVRQGSTSDVPGVELNNVKAVDARTAWVVGDADSGFGVILHSAGKSVWRSFRVK